MCSPRLRACKRTGAPSTFRFGYTPTSPKFTQCESTPLVSVLTGAQWQDGNGRMARLLGSVPLIARGLPPLIVTTDYRLRYLQVLGRMTATGEQRDLLPLARELVTSTRSAIAYLRTLPSSLDDSAAAAQPKAPARPRPSEPLPTIRVES